MKKSLITTVLVVLGIATVLIPGSSRAIDELSGSDETSISLEQALNEGMMPSEIPYVLDSEMSVAIFLAREGKLEGTLEPGKYPITYQEREWVKVAYQGKEGWIRRTSNIRIAIAVDEIALWRVYDQIKHAEYEQAEVGKGGSLWTKFVPICLIVLMMAAWVVHVVWSQKQEYSRWAKQQTV